MEVRGLQRAAPGIHEPSPAAPRSMSIDEDVQRVDAARESDGAVMLGDESGLRGGQSRGVRAHGTNFRAYDMASHRHESADCMRN